ncbi:hypothetical protein AB0D08_01100 [Kitasatospora sp. NPDC048540]|uniref:hypothetical protein n=1 Tax=unclassified Kitasatospora TaxID=2633591 RepID=UPI00053BB883|nr:hypothetical protein [Kitasatospora sp. MBT63]
MQAGIGAVRTGRGIGRVRSVGDAVRLAERALLGGARRNAWSAVCENRRHAADRVQDAVPSAAAGPRV